MFLQSCGIMRGGQSDHLYWFMPSVPAPVRVKDIYSELIIIKVSGTASMFPKALWKTGCLPRMIFFAWVLFNNRNLTWENLRKRCWHGPSRCSMCESDEETNLHMFFQCISTQEIWYELAFLYDFLTLSSILCMQPFNGGFHNVKHSPPPHHHDMVCLEVAEPQNFQ